MTDPRIIFPTPDGGIAIIIPTGELPIEEVAAKDVPAGVPYRVIDASDLPLDRTFRNAWTADFSDVEVAENLTPEDNDSN